MERGEVTVEEKVLASGGEPGAVDELREERSKEEGKENEISRRQIRVGRDELETHSSISNFSSSSSSSSNSCSSTCISSGSGSAFIRAEDEVPFTGALGGRRGLGSRGSSMTTKDFCFSRSARKKERGETSERKERRTKEKRREDEPFHRRVR